MRIRVTGVVCGNCGEFVWSRSRHDMRYCGCGKSFADGGRDYLRHGGESEVTRTVETLVVETPDAPAAVL